MESAIAASTGPRFIGTMPATAATNVRLWPSVNAVIVFTSTANPQT